NFYLRSRGAVSAWTQDLDATALGFRQQYVTIGGDDHHAWCFNVTAEYVHLEPVRHQQLGISRCGDQTREVHYAFSSVGRWQSVEIDAMHAARLVGTPVCVVLRNWFGRSTGATAAARGRGGIHKGAVAQSFEVSDQVGAIFIAGYRYHHRSARNGGGGVGEEVIERRRVPGQTGATQGLGVGKVAAGSWLAEDALQAWALGAAVVIRFSAMAQTALGAEKGLTCIGVGRMGRGDRLDRRQRGNGEQHTFLAHGYSCLDG